MEGVGTCSTLSVFTPVSTLARIHSGIVVLVVVPVSIMEGGPFSLPGMVWRVTFSRSLPETIGGRLPRSIGRGLAGDASLDADGQHWGQSADPSRCAGSACCLVPPVEWRWP